MLEAECRAAGVQIFLGCAINEIRRTDVFNASANPDEFQAPALVVATGGLSIPKLGATSLGYDIARQFGLKIRGTKPALVPFTLSAADREQYCDFAGVSADVEVSADHQSFREKMLITHRGLSGPAILQISTYWHSGSPIRIDLAPGREPTQAIHEGKERNKVAALAALQGVLPKRFATRWLDLHAPQAWSNRDLQALEHEIHNWVIKPAGTEGYEKAEVTSGGVDTDELSGKTMESRRVLGLFFIGEVVDVTGHLGGFNFQWAWASGAATGRAV
jgi:predicted Rossmann fold flavoprotein